jgi:hypothetical protein
MPTKLNCRRHDDRACHDRDERARHTGEEDNGHGWHYEEEDNEPFAGGVPNATDLPE